MASLGLRGMLRSPRNRGRRAAIWVVLALAAAYLLLFGFVDTEEEDNFDDLYADESASTTGKAAAPTPSPPKRERPPPEKSTRWSLQSSGKIIIPIDDEGDVEQPEGSSGKPVHPILELIEGAEKKWKDLVRRQSKTLPDAVKEYQRRYGRMPPKGFDKWFEFAQKQNVILIDEFDQIDHDIAPYLALAPRMMQQRARKLETHPESYHLIFKDGDLNYTHSPVRDTSRITDLVALVEDFAHLFPNMEVHASLHDTGSHILREDYRREALRKVDRGDFLSKDRVSFFENKATIKRKRVTKACLDNTPAVLQENGLSGQDSKGKSMEFIQDHRTSMNFCYNPEIITSHGTFTWDLARDSFLEPYFVVSKILQGPEILMPPLVGFGDTRFEKTPAWSTRKAMAFWRGSTTGNHFTIKSWKRSHRIALHLLGNAQEGEERILVEDPKKGLTSKSFSKKEMNERYMDVGLVGKPIQCDNKDGTCEAMAKEIDFKPRAAPNLGSQYKYAIDVDGNGWSQRYRRLLTSGSVILKATIFPEWNADWLIPWYHYVPIQMDYSDLYNTMAFFAGPPDGSSPGHDKLGEQISQNGLRFVKENWRWEDIQAYMFRLLLEYARLVADNRDAMTYKP
ncbi:F-actin-capping protein subunit alpha [Tulasnella sp. 427]|nr:F-actin-capping protein subunit alpha [Tulasnella sp. 427]